MDTDLIYCGDNKDILSRFPAKSVDLIYADPPFFTNKQYELIWKNGAETKVYEDRWKGGINVYIEWMKERLWQCHRVLKDTGSMYLHCDWHASHRLKIAMDDIFGENNFRNEIIWHYKFRMMYSERIFNRKHDVILFYAKSPRAKIRMKNVAERWTREEIIKTRKQAIYKDDDGREWIWMPGGKGHSKNKKKYLDTIIKERKALDDVWDILPITSSAKERLGYPTQKPETLLARIIEASSKKNSIVLDPFAGGGTTPAVAQQKTRRWIAIDVSPIACNLMKDRLVKAGATNVRIIGAPKTTKELKKLSDWAFQNWVVERIAGTPSPKKSDDKGVDGYTFMTREPIQVKQSEGVGRNVVDNFQTAIRRKQKTTGYIFAFSFVKGAYEEASRAKQEDGIDIKLIRIDEMDKEFPIQP